MIISVDKIKDFVTFPDNWTDEKIKMKLLAVEQTIRAYTNNRFQDVDYRRTADIVGGSFLVDALTPFDVGDTVQISETTLNKGLFTVVNSDDSTFEVAEPVKDEKDVLVTKISYPPDVVDCCVNLMEWEVNNRGKVGIKSETLSRHSVTYEDSASMFRGYPKGILSTVSHYRKVRC
jgi:hypothetical protein